LIGVYHSVKVTASQSHSLTVHSAA